MTGTWTVDRQHQLEQCLTYVEQALMAAANSRTEGWIETERFVVAAAANSWAIDHDIAGHVTVADVERIEQRAIGHCDYARKLALYVAGFLLTGEDW